MNFYFSSYPWENISNPLNDCCQRFLDLIDLASNFDVYSRFKFPIPTAHSPGSASRSQCDQLHVTFVCIVDRFVPLTRWFVPYSV